MSFQIESPHAVRKLSGGKTPDLPVDLYLPDFKGVILMIEWILYFYTSASGLPIIIKNIYTEQFALAVRTNCFKFNFCYSAAFTDSNSSIISCEGFLSRSDTTTIAASATMKAGRSS